jgi:hypothetical protein
MLPGHTVGRLKPQPPLPAMSTRFAHPLSTLRNFLAKLQTMSTCVNYLLLKLCELCKSAPAWVYCNASISVLNLHIDWRPQVIELPIKHPELFEALGVAQPKGVLLHGPPGTGKTLLARAVAHHTDCTFIRVSGSELVQKYIGEGSRMVCPF